MSSLHEPTQTNTTWDIPAVYRGQLLGTDGLRLNDWLRTGQARLVKHGPNRTVYHVRLPGLDFYLKHYRIYDLLARLRQLLRPAKARSEYRRTKAVCRCGVPTFAALGVGECRSGPAAGESYLLTRTLADTEALNTFIERTFAGFDPRRQARIRQRLATSLGRLVRQMHDAGIRHNDLHAGNLLVHLGPNDEIRLYLIDLHAVRISQPLRNRARRNNLVMLNRWFIVRASAADRLRFWHAYTAESKVQGPKSKVNDLGSDLSPAELEGQTWESYHAFWRRRDRRCLGTNKYFTRLWRRAKAGQVAANASRDLEPSEFQVLLADPDEPFLRRGIRMLKDSRSATVAEFDALVGGTPRRVVYKRFRVAAWTDPLANLFRRTAAMRSWALGHALLDRGIPTARPLAVLHRRRRGLIYEGYLLAEKIEGCMDLHGFLATLNTLSYRERTTCLRRRVEQLARLVRALHRRRLSHRDLKAANILTPPAGQVASGYGCWLIDLVGVRRCRRLPRARRVQNLARLNASFLQSLEITRTERLRFLRIYLRWGLLGRHQWKRWWLDVEKATEAKVRRNVRSGRPLL